jgi:scyllo-inositol 2-dehydrogenase (NAD+)
MARLNCGVIGLGRLGLRHAQSIAGRIGDARLTAVADPVRASRDSFVEQFPSVKAFTDHHELIASKDVDAVVIASSTNTHARIIREAVDAGKFVFCEKPVTLDLEEAAALRKLLEKKKAFVQVGFMRRFDDGYVRAKKRMETGELGEPVYIRCVSRDPSCPPIEFAKASGGLFLDLCVHDIDLARWFLGSEVTRVFAQGGVLMWPELESIGDIDHANIEFAFANGCMASLEGSRNARYGYDIRTEIICTKGAIFIGDLHNSPCVVLNASGETHDVVPGFLERFDQAYLNEMKAFVRDAMLGNEPSVTVEDGIAAIELALAAKKSQESGLPVQLPQRSNE